MKGFTLIELLAVIVILAIILLISVPIISNVIESFKISAFESSVKMIIKSAELAYTNNSMQSNSETVTYVFDAEGNQSVTPAGHEELDFTGSKPSGGYVIVHEDGKIELALTDGNNYILKTKDSEIIAVEDYVDQSLVPSTEEPAEVTTAPDVWMINGVDNNDGFMTLAPAQGSNNFNYSSQFSTTLGGVAINAITDNGNTYYLITNEVQFKAVRNNLNGKYIQMNDIVVTGNLSPIGATVGSEWQSVPFTGYYNGRGFNLEIQTMDTAYAGAEWGLFPKTDGATLIGLDVIYPNGFYAGTPLNRGGLVANAINTVIKESSVRIGLANEISGKAQKNIGGLVGLADNTQITDCYVIGVQEITHFWSSEEFNAYGGLVGNLINNSLVERTYTSVEMINGNTILNISLFGPNHYISGSVGFKDATSIVRQSYYNSDLQLFQKSGFGTGVNTAYLKNINNFTEFRTYQGL